MDAAETADVYPEMVDVVEPADAYPGMGMAGVAAVVVDVLKMQRVVVPDGAVVMADACRGMVGVADAAEVFEQLKKGL